MKDVISSLEMFDSADVTTHEESNWLPLSTRPSTSKCQQRQVPWSDDIHDLRWDSHIAEVTSRANRILGFVSIYSRRQKYRPTKVW